MLTFKIVQIPEDSSNHERTRIDTKKLSDSRPFVFIRGSFFVPSSLGYAPVIFAVLTFKIAQIPEDSSNHEWTRIKTEH